MIGPRCYAHDDPTFHGFDPNGPGRPAHVWGGTGTSGTCQRCPEPVRPADLYLCVEDGIIHAECPSRQPESHRAELAHRFATQAETTAAAEAEIAAAAQPEREAGDR